MPDYYKRNMFVIKLKNANFCIKYTFFMKFSPIGWFYLGLCLGKKLKCNLKPKFSFSNFGTYIICLYK